MDSTAWFHRYAVRRAAELLGRTASELNLITCHLGNGCSLAAIRGGVSVDTTMGFTPLEGLLMGSRSRLGRPSHSDSLAEEVRSNAGGTRSNPEQRLGIEGNIGPFVDMREIEAARAHGEKRAVLAFDCFVHQLCRGIGAMMASAGLPHAFVFTGGIGENSAAVREAACDRFAAFGISIDRGTTCGRNLISISRQRGPRYMRS